jgi:Immunity protein family (Imm11)
VEIASQPDQYLVMNTLKLVKCVDEIASKEVYHWTPGSGDPNRAGKYVAVLGLRIDPSKVGNARVFRPWGWEIALIVSEEIKEAMEHLGVTGAKFEEVG